MAAIYNDFDKYACAAMRQCIALGSLPFGRVIERSITELHADELEGFQQVHLFAGTGAWAVAARIAGWRPDRELWSCSCPCQPYSAAGKRRGASDPRHLWPDGFRLVRARRPTVIVGEQVAGALGYGWFDGVRSDLESEGYACRAVDVPACSVDAPHIRNRLIWIAVRDDLADAIGSERDGWRIEQERIEERRSAARRIDASSTVADSAGAGRQRPGLREAGALEHGPEAGDDARANGPASMVDADSHRQFKSSGLIEGRGGWSGHANAGYGALDDAAGSRREIGEPAAPRAFWNDARDSQSQRRNGGVGYAERTGLEGLGRHGENGGGRSIETRSIAPTDGRNGSFWAAAEWLLCHDGKARRTQPDIRLLVDGLPGRIPLWRAAGNSIVVPLAVEAIKALMEILP